jgi:hypothetical protein
MLQFRGSVITSDAGLLPYRELDDTLGLADTGGDMLADARTGRNGRHRLVGSLRQSVFGRLAANAVRLQLHALTYNLGNFMPTLAMPKTAEPWSLTSLREKLIKIGAKVVSHGRYVTFQMAEAAVPRQMFAEILSLIARLRSPPAPA